MNYSLSIKEKQSFCSKRVAELKKNPTKSELHIVSLFDKIKVRAMFQKGFIAGENFCIADFYIPSCKTVLEIDGGYHLTSEQIRRDRNKDWYYSQRKFRVIRITDERALAMNESDLMELIRR